MFGVDELCRLNAVTQPHNMLIDEGLVYERLEPIQDLRIEGHPLREEERDHFSLRSTRKRVEAAPSHPKRPSVPGRPDFAGSIRTAPPIPKPSESSPPVVG